MVEMLRWMFGRGASGETEMLEKVRRWAEVDYMVSLTQRLNELRRGE